MSVDGEGRRKKEKRAETSEFIPEDGWGLISGLHYRRLVSGVPQPAKGLDARLGFATKIFTISSQSARRPGREMR